MHSSAPGPHKKARIEIIPLIDIMFFLLAAFMLVSLSLVKLQGARVDLPSAGKPPDNPQQQKPDITTINVDKDGNALIGDERTPVALNALTAWADNLIKEKGPDAKVYINGSPDTTHGAVIAIFDKVRRGGLTKVTLAVKPVRGPIVNAAGAPGAAPAAPGTAPAPAAPAAPPAAPAPPTTPP